MIQSEEVGYVSGPWASREQATSFSSTKLGRTSLVAEEALQFPTSGSYGRYAPLYLRQPASRIEYATTSDNNLTRGLRAAGIIVICCLGSNDDVRVQAFPTTPIKKIAFSGDFVVGESKPLAVHQKAPLAAELIGQIRNESGLTLELIAPLLGVSRRTVQSWKAGGEISLRNEERLRELAEAIKRLPGSNPKETKDLLLERIPGVVRIYDQLAERRFDDAIARAHRSEKPEPIYSDPSIVFQHPPIDSQLAVIEDEPFESAGQLNRKVSRRLKL